MEQFGAVAQFGPVGKVELDAIADVDDDTVAVACYTAFVIVHL